MTEKDRHEASALPDSQNGCRCRHDWVHGFCRSHGEAKRMDGTCACPKPAIDAAHLHRQREWSRQTFGPGRRTQGVLDHIRKELVEIEDNPESDEWVDVVILALDGAWRHGMEPQQIIDAIRAKQAKNEARVWPDWRLSDEDHAIEHDRSFDA